MGAQGGVQVFGQLGKLTMAIQTAVLLKVCVTRCGVDCVSLWGILSRVKNTSVLSCCGLSAAQLCILLAT
jgi:hypothetical protein